MKRVAGSRFLFKIEYGDRLLICPSTGTMYVAKPECAIKLWDDELGKLVEIELDSVREFMTNRITMP